MLSHTQNVIKAVLTKTLRWRHNGHDCVSNHQPRNCLLYRLFGRRSKKASKLRVSGLCVGNSPGTGEFPAQMASNAENVTIWWRYHGFYQTGWSRLANAKAPVTPNETIIHIHCLESNMIYQNNVPIPQLNWNRYWTIICQYNGNGHRLFAN